MVEIKVAFIRDGEPVYLHIDENVRNIVIVKPWKRSHIETRIKPVVTNIEESLRRKGVKRIKIENDYKDCKLLAVEIVTEDGMKRGKLEITSNMIEWIYYGDVLSFLENVIELQYLLKEV